MVPHPFPCTPPPLPHSISSPMLSSPHLFSPAPATKNYHPYLIQTTSSSLLTRSNSSPSQPLNALGNHRPSRSMSSLSHAAGVDVVEERAVESPNSRPGMKRSGTLPSFPAMAEKADNKEANIPLNPKAWTPSELAQYLGQTLRKGGPDGTGQILPAPLVEDIKTWVLRQQVTGRAFLKSDAEGWANASRPPPFLPLLQSISRRLRRSSLQSRIARTSDSHRSSTVTAIADESALGTGSLVLEEEEVRSDDEAELTGVRRMANAFDARGSASEASGDEEPGPEKLKAQWTGGSTSSESWKRVELKRNDTGGSRAGGFTRKRRESLQSQGGMADVKSSPVGRNDEVRESSPDSEIGTPMDDVAEEVDMSRSTIKGEVEVSTTELEEPSPPPPYASPSSLTQSPRVDLPTRLLREETPLRSDRSSITPTPDRPHESSSLGLSPSTPIDTPSKESVGFSHMSHMLEHKTLGVNPYAALRRTSSTNSANGGSRLPSISSIRSSTPGDDELEATRWTTARRVTLRPDPVQGLFRAQATSPEKSHREVEMETQVASLLDRIKDLETRLNRVSRPSTPVSPMLAIFPEIILNKLGLGAFDPDDPLPKRIIELPAYLFFVGVGVGAVMVRVLFGRAR